MTAQEVKKVTRPRRKPAAAKAAVAPETVDKPEVPLPTSNVLSVGDALARLLETGPQKMITVSVNKDGNLSLVSAGEIDTATAIVLLSNALATVYGEMGAEVHQQVPVSSFLNNVNNVVSKRVMQTHPDAPLFNPITMDTLKHESEPTSTGTDPAN